MIIVSIGKRSDLHVLHRLMVELWEKWRASRLLMALYVGFSPTSGCTDSQISHADQVVGRDSEGENPLNLSLSPVPDLAQTAYRLEPSEDLFYSFALAQAHGVAIMAGRSGIDA